MRAIVALILLASAVSGSALAQKPFASVTVRAGGASNVGWSALHDYWDPGAGGELSASTPFYFGTAELGAALHGYENVAADVPRFDALLAYLGWGVNLSPADGIFWHNGLRVGNYRMSFDEETFAGVRNESELTIGLQSRFELRLSPLVHLYAAGQYLRIYTAPRFDLAYVSGGIGISFDSPTWLRRILR